MFSSFLLLPSQISVSILILSVFMVSFYLQVKFYHFLSSYLCIIMPVTFTIALAVHFLPFVFWPSKLVIQTFLWPQTFWPHLYQMDIDFFVEVRNIIKSTYFLSLGQPNWFHLFHYLFNLELCPGFPNSFTFKNQNI